jgi:DNA-binding transcriptional regulator PaaX
VPTGQNAQRERLRRYLRDKGFGYLQNSVWISPIHWRRNANSSAAERSTWKHSSCWRHGPARVPSPIGWERVAARPGEGGDFAEIVAGAWDFERMNRRYARHLKILEERPGNAL